MEIQWRHATSPPQGLGARSIVMRETRPPKA